MVTWSMSAGGIGGLVALIAAGVDESGGVSCWRGIARGSSCSKAMVLRWRRATRWLSAMMVLAMRSRLCVVVKSSGRVQELEAVLK